MFMKENFDFSGKTAIITGSSRGLGKEMARLFAQVGARVILSGRSKEKLEQVAAEIKQEGGKAVPLPVDVTSKNSVQEFVEKAFSQTDDDKIDILVNNAGVIFRAPATELSEEEWDETVNTNLKGTFLVSQAVGKKMVENQGGSIINIASDKGLVGYPERAAYCASKGGVIQLTKALAVEWAPYQVKVNAVAPTYIETEMTRDILQDPVKYEEVTKTIPMKRVSQPHELFGAVLLLASDSASFITGHTLAVDGGLTAW